MNKAAYLHSLSHLALTTHTFYMTITTKDYTRWEMVRDKYQNIFEDGILYAN